MEQKVVKKKKKLSREKHTASRHKTWWVVSVILLVFIAGGVYLYWHKTGASQQVDPTKLRGRWLRFDGGYILELKEIDKDGSLKAAYFNPRPINVAKAVHSRKDGKLTIFVELRDVNYPGSTYTLVYQGENDRLVGIYYQALLRQQFDVEFIRMR